MSYFSLKNGLTPRTCKIHLPPSIVAISSCDINSLPQCQVVNSKKDKHYQRKQSFIVLVLFLFMFSALHCSKRRTIIYSMEVRNGLYDIERGR